jgi:hypothetical protein
MTRADVNEVNVHVIDRCHELRQGVELGLGLPPVVVRSPITHQPLQFCELYSLRLVVDRLSIGPSRGGDASAKVNELRFWKIDAERADCVAFGRHSGMCGKQTDGTNGC